MNQNRPACSAVRTRAITSDHSSPSPCRNNCSVGYQGLSSRSLSQCQSDPLASNTQAGRPSAPAKCATEVSTVTTKSRSINKLAVSAKSISSPVTSCTREPHSTLPSAAEPFNCRLHHSIPGQFTRESKSVISRHWLFIVLADPVVVSGRVLVNNDDGDLFEILLDAETVTPLFPPAARAVTVIEE